MQIYVSGNAVKRCKKVVEEGSLEGRSRGQVEKIISDSVLKSNRFCDLLKGLEKLSSGIFFTIALYDGEVYLGHCRLGVAKDTIRPGGGYVIKTVLSAGSPGR
ncbi:hypothetical protein CMI37_18450 [Candidatus Pacearchaeota archaeon]|nr:hypothetical protein [Candidatus Pacearchaeota archaeon]|tara:strand:- start:1219 stop:1527 length:309 start_codon:yes stop_codon:yes gene_type:complete